MAFPVSPNALGSSAVLPVKLLDNCKGRSAVLIFFAASFAKVNKAALLFAINAKKLWVAVTALAGLLADSGASGSQVRNLNFGSVAEPNLVAHDELRVWELRKAHLPYNYNIVRWRT